MKYREAVIDDICSFVGGSQPPKETFRSNKSKGYIRLIQTRDYKTDNFLTYIPLSEAKKTCNKDDIMIGRYGPPIFQIFRGLEGAYNVALMKAIPKENISKDYLYFFLKQDSIFQYVDRLSLRTGGQTGVDLSCLRQYPLKLFDYEYQQKIASVLSNLDAKIDLNNRINAELEAMAKLIYDYWFVQFDFPNEEGKPYKASGGKMVYHEGLKREIPEGWEVIPLYEVTTEIKRGISPKYLNQGGIPVINQKCIRNNTINFGLARRHNQIEKDPSSKFIQKGDILVNSTGVGTLGRVAIVKYLLEMSTTIDSHVTLVRGDLEKVNPNFLGFSLLNQQKEIENFGRGSTGQTELSRNDLGKISILCPPSKIQSFFGGFLDPIFKKMEINERENYYLEELRDWLLPMLMNGQVRVG